MPTPRDWTSPEELITAMARYPWQERFERNRHTLAATDRNCFIRRYVGGNTFRAFRRLPHSPAMVFRDRAYHALFERPGYFPSLLTSRSQRDYDRWIDSLAQHLRSAWKREMEGHPMPFGPSLKLPSLIMKWLCFSSEVPQPSFDRLIWRLHIPLDSYSIQAVRNCVSEFPNAVCIGRVPRSAGMGFITNVELYRAFQAGMRLLAQRAGVPPIVLDYVAWDGGHTE